MSLLNFFLKPGDVFKGTSFKLVTWIKINHLVFLSAHTGEGSPADPARWEHVGQRPRPPHRAPPLRFHRGQTLPRLHRQDGTVPPPAGDGAGRLLTGKSQSDQEVKQCTCRVCSTSCFMSVMYGVPVRTIRTWSWSWSPTVCPTPTLRSTCPTPATRSATRRDAPPARKSE